MKKVAIVGVEGSGKTVMLAGLGELYTRPDENGYFLTPKNFTTASYVTDKIQRMRSGEWPSATAGDEMQGLDWVLKQKKPGQRPVDLCEVSFLDFAGEVYRTAFGIRKSDGEAELAAEAESLKKYIRDADELIVLINLHDLITKGRGDPRVEESMWITNEILTFALDDVKGRKPTRAAIVISQSDTYKDTIESCGGPAGVLKRYLPHVSNNYDWLDLFAVSAVDKSILDDSGNIIPAPDFQPVGLKPIMSWIRNEKRVKRTDAEGPTPDDENGVSIQSAGRQLDEGGFFSALKKPSDYKGRASRKEYWHYLLGVFIVFVGVLVGAAWFDDANSSTEALETVEIVIACVIGVFMAFSVYTLVPLLSLQVRRAHDIGLPGWVLWFVIPTSYYGIGVAIALLVLGFVPGKRVPNKYGAPIGVE